MESGQLENQLHDTLSGLGHIAASLGNLKPGTAEAREKRDRLAASFSDLINAIPAEVQPVNNNPYNDVNGNKLKDMFNHINVILYSMRVLKIAE